MSDRSRETHLCDGLEEASASVFSNLGKKSPTASDGLEKLLRA